MNAPDVWADFAAVFADELQAAAIWTPEQMQAMSDEYQRDAIAGANSEAAQEAARKEHSK